MKTQKGFTLVELMIVVVIIGILSAVAVPSYRDYVTRGRIPDATSNLATKRVQMEQWFQDNRRYNSAANATTCGVNTSADTTSSQYFTFTCATLTDGNSYLLTATGKDSMTGFTYTINEANTKTSDISAAGWSNPTPNTCWITKKGGAC